MLIAFIVQAEKEPILSSFLYASILSHDCLEQALAFVVANRLQNPTLLATQLMDIFCNVIMHDEDIQRSIRLDVQVICFLCVIKYLGDVCLVSNLILKWYCFSIQAFKDRDPACLSYCSAILYMKVNHFFFLPSSF